MVLYYISKGRAYIADDRVMDDVLFSDRQGGSTEFDVCGVCPLLFLADGRVARQGFFMVAGDIFPYQRHRTTTQGLTQVVVAGYTYSMLFFSYRLQAGWQYKVFIDVGGRVYIFSLPM